MHTAVQVGAHYEQSLLLHSLRPYKKIIRKGRPDTHHHMLSATPCYELGESGAQRPQVLDVVVAAASAP